MDKIEFGKFIYSRRKKFNLSQQALANELCLSGQAISNWERGVSYPEISYLEDISRILKISIENLCLLKDVEEEFIANVNRFDILKFSKNLTILRKLNNMSQSELAGKLNIQYQTISSWERGVSLPTIEQIIDLSKLFNISINDLYYGNNKIIKKEEIKTKKNFRPLLLITLAVIILGIFSVAYFANDNSNNNNFKINFEGFDDFVETKNDRITKFPDASKEGYKFLGWYYNDKLITESTIITSDMVLMPKYERLFFTITFIVEDKVYKEMKVEYGSSLYDFPEVPVKQVYNGFWDVVEIKNIKSDITIHAVYKLNEYQVVLLDENGELIEIQYVKHGETIKDINLPIKEGYTFMGWSEDISIITSNITCNAIYKINEYTITFMNEGQVVKQEKAQYNTIITLPEFMKKGYSFDGFLYQDKIYKESLTVKENITLVAKYTKLPVYNIIFKNEIGDIIKTTSAYVGEEFTDLFEYDSDEVFNGWMLDGEYISYPFVFNYQNDIVLYASLIKAKDLYTITNLNDTEVAIVGLEKDLKVKSLIIPDYIDNKKVVRVTSNVFSNNSNLEYIKLGEYITKVDDYCFQNCINLKEAYLNNNIEHYGESIFKGCYNLETIHINGNFDNCLFNFFEGDYPTTFENVYINEGTMIKNTDNWNSTIMPYLSVSINLYLPSDLKIIKKDTFVGPTYIRNIYINSSFLTIETGAFKECYSHVIFKEKAKELVIEPEAFECNEITIKAYKATIDLTSLASNTIIECDYLTLQSRLILNFGNIILKCKEIENIEQYMFNNSGVKVEIYGVVKNVQKNGFNSLSSLTFYNKQNIINWDSHWCGSNFDVIYKYDENKYKIIFDSNGGEYIEPIIMENDTIESLPTPVKEGYIFKGWYSQNQLIDLPMVNINMLDIFLCAHWLQTIDEYEVEETENNELKLIGIKSVNDLIIIPSSLNGKKIVVIGTNCISSENVKKVVLSDQILLIENDAFINCENLKEIVFGDNIKDYGGNILLNCNKLETITINALNIPFVTLFNDTKNIPLSLKTIKLKKANDVDNVLTMFRYLSNNYHYEFNINIVDNIDTIKESYFGGVDVINSITIPDSVIKIEALAFSGCPNLKNVYLGNSIKYIGERAFYGSDNLESIVLPNSIETIESYAFQNCTSLKQLSLPKKLKIVKQGSLLSCNSLNTLCIPLSVKIIEEDNLLSNLKTIYYEGTEVEWSKLAYVKKNQDILKNMQIIYEYSF